MSERLVRFTESARNALNLAHQEARRLKHGFVGAEHLLAGLMLEDMGMAGIILRTQGVVLKEINKLISKQTPSLMVQPAGHPLDYSPGCKRAIQRAISEAQSSGVALVSTEHLLIALVSQADGRASRLLNQVGVSPAAVEAHIRQVLSDGQSSAAIPSVTQHSSFHTRYKIERVVGVGSQSTVYRARDMKYPNLVKLVAVKEMTVEAVDPLVRNQVIRNFRQEAEILAGLKHPFIPRFYDFFNTGNQLFIVMEYIVGETLEAILDDSTGLLSVHQVVDWGIQLCDVLSYLHHHPLRPTIFRDLKPSNVMVDQYNNIRLIDFNIARVFRLGQRRTSVGTQGYSPPEQYHGEVNPRVDIYALGATLHHLLTRQDPRLEPPFSFNQRPIRRVNPQVSEALSAVIERALAYNPGDRYPDVEEMRIALINARQGVKSS